MSKITIQFKNVNFLKYFKFILQFKNWLFNAIYYRFGKCYYNLKYNLIQVISFASIN